MVERNNRLHPYSIVVEPKPPYMFSSHLEHFTLPGRTVPNIFDRGLKRLRRLLVIDDVLVAFDAFFSGEPWRPRLEVRVYTSSPGLGERVASIVRDMLRVDFNYKEFLEKLKPYKRLYELALHYPGLRPGRCISLYYALIDTVVKQRISLKQSLQIMAGLVEAYGPRRIINGLEYYDYPRPETLVRAGVEELRKKKLTRVKARSLVEIAKAELEGRLPGIEEASRNPYMIARELTRIYGVGEWTAKLAVAMVSPSFPIGPSNDLAVRRGLSRIFGRELDSREVEEILADLEDVLGLVMYLAAHEYEKKKKTR